MSLPPHRHYASEEEASRSKSCVQHGWTPAKCWHGLWILRAPETPRAPLMRRKPGKPKRRAAGPGKKTREIVLARDRYCCIRCGRAVDEETANLHHRKRRSQGGRHAPENLITTCGSGTTGCHGWIHANVTESLAAGWLVPGAGDPALIPVMRFSESGSRVTQWPTAGGGWTGADPNEVAA